jgi:plasmid maintenance system antidote protein VapI
MTGILKGERAVTADTALRLAREFWLNVQTADELRLAQRGAEKTIKRQVAPRAA